MSFHARAGRVEIWAPSMAGALKWAADMARIQRRLDEHSWEDVLDDAKAASAGSGYATLAEWDAAPDAYLGDCTKECYDPTIMVKGSVREFDAFGVYVCSGCNYAYPPGCEPNRSGLKVLALNDY